MEAILQDIMNVTCGRYSLMTGMRPRKRIHSIIKLSCRRNIPKARKRKTESLFTTLKEMAHQVYQYEEQPTKNEMLPAGIDLHLILENGKIG